MLESISIKNVKTLRDVSIPLAPMTVLAGPNGCGKTTTLKMIELMSKVVRRPPAEVLQGECSPGVLHTHGSSEDIAVRIDFTENHFLELTVRDAPPSNEQNVRWIFDFESDLKRLSIVHKPALSAARVSVELGGAVPSARYLRFEFERLIASSFTQHPDDQLSVDGANLPSVLATLFATDPERRDQIHSRLQRIVPTIRGVRPELAERTVEREVWEGPDIDLYHKASKQERGFQLRFELASGAIVAAHSVSEGTVLVLALLTFLLSARRPDLVLIDNLERGLHPRALKTLVGQLREIQTLFPSLQIVATTHSPYLLDCFEPSEIRLMCLDESGHTICGGIQDHPDFGRWKDEMLPGEFWSMVGEDWLLDKAAAAEPQQP